MPGYQKVQEIAEQAIEGSSQYKSFAELQKLLSGQKPQNPGAIPGGDGS